MSGEPHSESVVVARMHPERRQAILSGLAELNPLAVYVFGSVALGRERKESDLDLAFLPDRGVESWVVFQVAQQLATVLGKEVDLIDLSTASTVMRKEVLRTGYLLDETDAGRRREFEMYTLSDYARLNEERAPVLAALGTAQLTRHAR